MGEDEKNGAQRMEDTSGETMLGDPKVRLVPRGGRGQRGGRAAALDVLSTWILKCLS